MSVRSKCSRCTMGGVPTRDEIECQDHLVFLSVIYNVLPPITTLVHITEIPGNWICTFLGISIEIVIKTGGLHVFVGPIIDEAIHQHAAENFWCQPQNCTSQIADDLKLYDIIVPTPIISYYKYI